MSAGATPAARRIGDALRRAGEERCRFRWPSREYAGDPARFGRDVLGKRRYWSAQREWFREFMRPRAFLAISTGQKTGKTEAYETVVAHHFGTETHADFILFAPKLDHTSVVFWPRFVSTILGAFRPCRACWPAHERWLALVDADPYDLTPRPERCSACSPLVESRLVDPKDPSKGRVSPWMHPTDPTVGLVAPDGRRVIAYAAQKKGALGGLSGRALAFGTDESSDVSDDVREAIQGNAMGGAKFFGIGNPLYPTGWFARAFKDQRDLYTFTAMVSSRTTPNCTGEEPPIPGLADLDGIRAGEVAWKGSPSNVAARIDGKFPEIIEGQLSPLGVVRAAEVRFQEGLAGEGPLQIGVDVGRTRDFLAIAPRRGRRIFEVQTHIPRDHATGAALVLDVARKYRRLHECKPRVAYDASGKEGQDFGREIRRYADELELYPIVATHPPRNRIRYDKLRDEIAFTFADWLLTGALPPIAELETEIDATIASVVEVSYGGSGRKWEVMRVVSNDELREQIGRSPDQRDACQLAVWPVTAEDLEALQKQRDTGADPPPPAKREHRAPRRQAATGAHSPYGAADVGLAQIWGRS